MKYLLMIYGAESADPQPGTTEFSDMMTGYKNFTEEVQTNGAMLGGEPLEPVATATTVRVRDQQTHITDGPFAETKEVLGGYYLLDCADLDEAIAYAAKIPTAQYGCVEIRPIMHYPELDEA